MITWFDALLVTIWAAVTVIGARRGLGGLVWAVAATVAVFVANFLPWTLVAVVAAALLGAAASFGANRAVAGVEPVPWHAVVGGAGGLLMGFVLVAALALSLPVKVLGSQGSYPSSDLPAPLYYATFNSMIVRDLTDWWHAAPVVKRLFLPDQLR